MIITRTPFRVSFFGGGTDYPAWYRQNGGAVLSATINKYCYLTLRYKPPFHEHRYRIVYRKIETCLEREQIEHPVVRAVLQKLDIRRGLEIHHDSDLPARAGMGSSSAFTVGLLNALHAHSGRIRGKHELAREAIVVEQDILGETVGSQDQTASAYGGLNHIQFLANDTIVVRPLTLSAARIEEFQSHLMLFFTGISRTAEEVALSYVDKIHESPSRLEALGGMVDEGIGLLSGRADISEIGALLHEAWQVKQSLSPQVSNRRVDEIYETARRAGALGGKLSGAGGGGFMLLFVPPDRQAGVRQALDDLVYVPLSFDFDGSKVVFFEPEEDWQELDEHRVTQKLRRFKEHASVLDEEKAPG